MFIFLLQFLFWSSIGLITYSYLVYPLILLAWDKLRPVKQPAFGNDTPGVSIIISAYNEEQVIGRRIANCLELDYPADRLEIIIASDGSTDGTCNIARQTADQRLKIEEFKERQGKVNVLNAVVPNAKYEIVVFSDANTLFEREAVRKLVRHFEDEKVGCVCGRLQFVNVEGSNSSEMEGVYWKYETFLKTIEGRRGYLLGANGALYAIRKKLFIRCPEDTIVEDFVLPMKILERGYKVMYDPQAVALEETAKHIVHEKQRRIRIGAGNFQALGMLKHMLNPVLGFSALAFWSHKVLRWFAPLLMIGVFVSNGLLVMVHSPWSTAVHSNTLDYHGLSTMDHGLLFLFFFLLQSLFYISAFIGQVLGWAGKNVKPFNLCYYFVSMNLALLLGFVRYLTGEQKVTWERTER